MPVPLPGCNVGDALSVRPGPLHPKTSSASSSVVRHEEQNPGDPPTQSNGTSKTLAFRGAAGDIPSDPQHRAEDVVCRSRLLESQAALAD